MDRLIGFDAQLLFDAAITGVNIFILFFGLSYLLFNPVRDFLNKRKEKIAGELANAETKEKDAIALKEEYEAKLREVNKEVENILEDARKKAKIREEEIIAEAKAEALRINERANKEIVLEKKKAIDELKQEMVGIATMVASKAVASSIDVNIQNDLIDKTLKEMGESTWQS